MRITCEFQADYQLTMITLLNGNNDVSTRYSFLQKTFELSPGSSVRLEVGPDTTFEGGSLTFIFPRVNCSDFTWYICRGTETTTGVVMYSSNITLQSKYCLKHFS